MKIMEVAALPNGGHRNQDCHGVVPDGWAVIPEGMELPNFPFGLAQTQVVDGVLTLTGWTPGELPEQEESRVSLEERVAALEAAVQSGLALHAGDTADGSDGAPNACESVENPGED